MKQEILKLQALLKKYKISAYLVPTSDYHNSEYLSDFFKEREFLSGFTGSAGTLLVTKEDAFLWTDGRYFIQAEKELADSGITLFKSGEDGVLSIKDFLLKSLKKSDTLAFDGRLLTTTTVLEYKKIFRKVKSINLVDFIWEERPSLPEKPIFELPEKFSGECRKSKLQKVREKLKGLNCNAHLLSSLDDIAWLLNLRGSDVENTPVYLSYLYITENNATLFVSPNAISTEIKQILESDNVTVKPYSDAFKEIKKLSKGKTTLLDFNSVNFELYKNIKGKTVNAENPTLSLKSIKNPTEIENLRSCHIKDGIAVTKFMMWVKECSGETEISVSDYLEKLRKENENYISPSFDTISAFNENAAMVHYSATPETDTPIGENGLLLVDSGGQYLEGTTDITRTFVIGKISDKAKIHYTMVLCGMLELMNAKFLYGCDGRNLDILARKPLWAHNLDYKHGTGHGVGYLLSVHEGPNAFRYRGNSAVFEEGMVTTDEPGFYLENEYGIRIENELLCKKDIKNEYGQFMSFETLTCAPIDLDGVDVSIINNEQKKTLNNYHNWVFEKLSPYFEGEDLEKLKHYTRKLL